MKHFLYRVVQFLLSLSAVLAGGIVVASFLGSLWWGFDLLSHFRFQYLIGLVMLLGVLMLFKKKLFILSTSVFFLLNFSQIFPFYLPNIPSARAGNDQQTVNALFANVYYKVDDVQLLRSVVQSENPDFAVFAELNASAFRELTQSSPEYPYVYFVEGYHAFDLSVISKMPLYDVHAVYFGDQRQSPTLIFSIYKNDQKLQVVGVHTHTPVTEELKEKRDAELVGLSEFVSMTDTPTLVFGDFNSTAWSSGFSVLKSEGRLTDSQLHQGVQASWPAYFPSLFRIPIDQALVSRDILVLDRKIGNDVGSDHLPVVLKLEW